MLAGLHRDNLPHREFAGYRMGRLRLLESRDRMAVEVLPSDVLSTMVLQCVEG